MNLISQSETLALVGVTLGFVLVAFVWPSIRMWLRTGKTGFVAHHPPTPVHRVAVEGFRVVSLLAFCWPAILAWRGAAALDFATMPAWLGALGWLLIGASILFVVVAQAQMGASWRIGIDGAERTALVTSGLFRWVRNPIFTGMMTLTLGVLLLTPSPWSLMGWLFLVFVITLQVRLEEEHLLRLHADDYRRYASQVGRFVPGLGMLPDAAGSRRPGRSEKYLSADRG